MRPEAFMAFPLRLIVLVWTMMPVQSPTALCGREAVSGVVGSSFSIKICSIDSSLADKLG